MAATRPLLLYGSLLRHTGKKPELVRLLHRRCLLPALISRVSSSWRVSWIFVYSWVIRAVLWPAIFDASMLDRIHQRNRTLKLSSRTACI